MEHPPTIFMVPEPAPFPSSPRSVDLAPLEFILAFIAVIAVPALIYTFFFIVRSLDLGVASILPINL